MSGAALPPNLFALLKGGAGLPKSKSSQDLISAIKKASRLRDVVRSRGPCIILLQLSDTTIVI